MVRKMSSNKKTKILFIISEFVPIGVELLTQIIKNSGFEVVTIYYDDSVPFITENDWNSDLRGIKKFQEFLVEQIHKEQPSIIGFSCFTSNYQWSLQCSKFIKSKFDIPIAFGGYHAIQASEAMIQENSIDIVCFGEGETTIVELLSALDKNKEIVHIKNLLVKINGKVYRNETNELIRDLDTLPYPDKSLFAKLDENAVSKGTYLMIGSRGCFYKCSFCSNNFLISKFKGWNRVRYRSPESIFAEIENYVNTHSIKLKLVDFTDDIVGHTNDRLAKLFYGFKEKFNIPYTCLIYPTLVDEESFKIFSETGCSMLRLGLQTTNEELRKKNLFRRETNDLILQIGMWAHKYNVPFAVDQLFGLPYERNEDLIDSVAFYNKLKPAKVVGHRLMYLPGTQAVNDAIIEGRLQESDIEKINSGTMSSWSWMAAQMPGAELSKDTSNYEVLLSRVSYLYSLIPIKSTEYIENKINNGFLTSTKPLNRWRIMFITGIHKLSFINIHLVLIMIKSIIFKRFRKPFFIFHHTKQTANDIKKDLPKTNKKKKVIPVITT